MHGHFMDTYKLSTFAGAMHRTLVGSRVRQHDAAPHRHGVQESVRNTAHTNSAQRGKLQSAAPAIPGAKEMGEWHGRLAERERTAPQAKPPAGREFGCSAPTYNYSKQNPDKEFM
jgi:hypothetical protein